MTDKATPDWELIETHYRAGVLSLREIAIACSGANHVAIARRAKKFGWVQDLSAKIKAKANDLVTRQAVTEAVTASRAVSDRNVIEANAQAIADIRMAHRGDIGRNRRLALKMMEELEALTDNRELFAQLSDLIAGVEEGEDGTSDAYEKMQQAFRGALSLPGRVKMSKDLSETLRVLIALERQAYGIDEGSSEESYEERLARLMEAKA